MTTPSSTKPTLTAGPYRVTILHDGVFEASTEVLRHLGGPDARAAMLAGFAEPHFRIPVHAFLVEDGTGKRLVDAGTGTAWGPAFGHALSALAETGTSAEDITEVLLTHLHGDHALGLFADGSPVFPQASIVVGATDFAFFTDPAERDRVPEARRSGWAIAEQVVSAYAGRIRTVGPGEVLPGIHLEPLPGHTPGHAGYRFVDGEQGDVLLWGDALHLTRQAGDPGIALAFDLDLAAAHTTRREVLARAARLGWRVGGGHVEGFSRVVAEGDGFTLLPIG